MREQIENPTGISCELNNSGSYTCSPSSPTESEILLELGSIGAGHAATSLSEILQRQVLIDIPKIHKIAPHMFHQLYQRDGVPTTAVYMELADAECDILLMIELAEARKIAAMMTMAPSIEELDPALEGSAIQELANILIGSFLTAISDFTDVKLIPTIPHRTVDTFETIMENFMVKQSLISNEVLIFDTSFKSAGEDANLMLMILPGSQLRELLVQKSKELMDV